MAKSKSKASKASSLEARAKAAMKEWLSPSNPELEKALYEGIEDEQRWLVYADWLQQIGDVRGEIIALGLAGKTAELEELAAKSEEFLWAGARDLEEKLTRKTFTPDWDGAEPEALEVALTTTLGKHGMIDAIEIRGLDEAGHVAKAAALLFSAPIARFVRRLSLECTYNDRFSGGSGQPNLGAVIAAIAKTAPAALHELSIGTGGYQLSWTNTGNLGPLLAVTPHLEHIAITHGDVRLGDSLDLPKLRSLSIVSGGLDRENLVAIGNAKWPSLTKLVLYFGCRNYGGNATRADVAALLAHPSHFPALTELALCNAEIQGDIVQELARSPLLAQVETLDLSKGTLIDDDVKVIVDNPGLFMKRTLDLGINYLSPEMERTLRSVFGERVSTAGQRYEDMLSSRARYENADWVKATKHTFRYTEVGE